MEALRPVPPGTVANALAEAAVLGSFFGLTADGSGSTAHPAGPPSSPFSIAPDEVENDS